MTGTSGTATIVFTDMVGSTDLLARLGIDRTIELRHDHDGLLRSCAAAHGGEVVDTNGDGLMMVFPTCTEAVEAALCMQRDVRAYARRSDAVAPFEIRIGIGAGEISVDGGAYFGEPVVEAARLEPLAQPGEILTTDLVKLLTQRSIDAVFEEMGEHTLKGLPDLVRVHRVFRESVTAALPLPSELLGDESFPLVGRDDASAMFSAVWEQSSGGELGLLLIAGEPGIGKSRLVAEAAKTAHAADAIVLYGSSDAELFVPYRPFASALRRAETLDNALAETLKNHTGTLAPLFPDSTREGVEELGEVDRLALFEAAADTLGRLATLRPVLLVLDDLHWATRSTVLLLRHLVRESPDHRILIVGTYRPDEVDRSHPMHDLLGDLSNDRRTHRLRLEPLTEQDVVALLESRTGSELDADALAFARRVHSDTNGSPFFTGELLRHLASTGTLSETNGVWSVQKGAGDLPVPESVRDVVGQRLGRLGGDLVDVLSSAAVIGFSFDLDLLAEVSGSTLDEVIDLVELGERATLVQEAGVANRYSFVHAIVRQTLLDDISHTRRARAHRRIAEALEQLPGNRIDELAHHWFSAVTPVDNDKAIHYLRLAAERDVAALAWEAAIGRYQQIIGLLEEHNALDGSVTLAETWLALGEALRACGDLEYRPTMEKAGRLARRADRADLLARAAVGCLKPGVWFVNAGDTDDIMIGMCEGALDDLDPHDPLRVRVLATLATVLAFDPDRPRREKLVSEAQQVARSIGDPYLLSSALIATFLALWDPSTYGERCSIADELTTLAHRTGDAEFAFLGGFFNASCALEGGDPDGALTHLGKLERPIAETRNFWFNFLVERMSNGISIARREPDMAPVIDEQLERSAETQADAPGTWAAQHATIALQDGRFGSMAGSLEASYERSKAQGIWSYALVIALHENGDIERANEVADELRAPDVMDFFWLVSMQMYAEIGYRLNRPHICAETLEALEPYRGRVGVVASGTLVWGLVSTTVGLSALATGDRGLAIDALSGAVREAKQFGSPYFGVHSGRLLTEALIAEGSFTDAAPALAEAAAVAHEHGFAGELQRLEALSSRLA